MIWYPSWFISIVSWHSYMCIFWQMEKLITYVKNAFKDYLLNKYWMDKKTLKKAAEKVWVFSDCTTICRVKVKYCTTVSRLVCSTETLIPWYKYLVNGIEKFLFKFMILNLKYFEIGFLYSALSLKNEIYCCWNPCK